LRARGVEMAGFKRFEDIQAWKKAKHVAQLVYMHTSIGHFATDYALRDQIRRACISVMSNIAEGRGRRSDKEFATFLNFAHGSVAETQSQLYLARDLAFLDDAAFSEIYSELEEISRMIMKLSQHLRANL
jgi:four helix bundle protein